MSGEFEAVREYVRAAGNWSKDIVKSWHVAENTNNALCGTQLFDIDAVTVKRPERICEHCQRTLQVLAK
jgi:hypothetical protein